MKNFVFAAAFCSAALLVQNAFAQEALHKAIDSGNWKKAAKMVKAGEIEEIYCGKISPKNAVTVYGKLFKQMPDDAFAACPTQFTYGYGDKACSDGRAMNACSEVVGMLLTDATKGSDKALKMLEKVAKAAAKTKAFAKSVKVDVDTTVWEPCPKKGKARAKCAIDCKNDANSILGLNRKVSCKTKPEHLVDKVIKVSRPSPVYERLRSGLVDGFWKSPMTSSAAFAKIAQANAKAFSIPDTAVPGIDYVKRWAQSHKEKNEALPGGQLFRFCTAWKGKVDPVLSAAGFDTRCPVFKTFVDRRDKKSYKVKNINGLNWFVQNLNFAVEEGSMCYDRDEENCKAYGRLYKQSVAKEACPAGYRLATDEDWKNLEEYAGGAKEAALKLRSNGSDDYAFTAMFGGYANKTGVSTTIGEGAYFWTDQVSEDGRGVARNMFSSDKEVSTITVDADFYLAVRCVGESKE